jgi:hypothetical protein
MFLERIRERRLGKRGEGMGGESDEEVLFSNFEE